MPEPTILKLTTTVTGQMLLSSFLSSHKSKKKHKNQNTKHISKWKAVLKRQCIKNLKGLFLIF